MSGDTEATVVPAECVWPFSIRECGYWAGEFHDNRYGPYKCGDCTPCRNGGYRVVRKATS